jgi:hypothetical protein
MLNHTQREHIGSVGVDSGQLMIMDPSYVESEWIPEDDAEIIGLKFWGSGQDIAATHLRDECDCEVETFGDAYLVRGKNIKKLRDHHASAETAALKQGKRIVSTLWTASSYHKICEQTLSDKQAGGVPYFAGHEGLLVATSTGIGDGFYDVFATYIDSPGWGRRIQKIEIVFMDEKGDYAKHVK